MEEEPRAQPLFWTMQQVAERLQLSVSTVRRLTWLEQLPSVRVGHARRYVPAQIEAWAAQAQGAIRTQ